MVLFSFDELVVNEFENTLLADELFAAVEAEICAVADPCIEATGRLVFEHYFRCAIFCDDEHSFFETFEQLNVALVRQIGLKVSPPNELEKQVNQHHVEARLDCQVDELAEWCAERNLVVVALYVKLKVTEKN